MVGESTYLGYLDPPEKICNISSQAKVSSSWTFSLLKLAILASDHVTKNLELLARSDVKLFQDIYIMNTSQTAKSVWIQLRVDHHIIHNVL